MGQNIRLCGHNVTHYNQCSIDDCYKNIWISFSSHNSATFSKRVLLCSVMVLIYQHGLIVWIITRISMIYFRFCCITGLNCLEKSIKIDSVHKLCQHVTITLKTNIALSCFKCFEWFYKISSMKTTMILFLVCGRGGVWWKSRTIYVLYINIYTLKGNNSTVKRQQRHAGFIKQGNLITMHVFFLAFLLYIMKN